MEDMSMDVLQEEFFFCNLLDLDSCNDIFEYMKKNKEKWSASQCLQNFNIKFDLRAETIKFGPTFKNNIIFFILNITEIKDGTKTPTEGIDAITNDYDLSSKFNRSSRASIYSTYARSKKTFLTKKPS